MRLPRSRCRSPRRSGNRGATSPRASAATRWPGFRARAFEEMAVARSFVGRQQIILSDPAAIRHVLIENADNYRRTAATHRLLGPVVGDGLFLADGRGLAHAAPRRRAGLRAAHDAGRRRPRGARRRPAGRRIDARRAAPRSICSPGCSCWRWRSPRRRCSRSTSRAEAPSCAPNCSAMPNGVGRPGPARFPAAALAAGAALVGAPAVPPALDGA